MRLSRICICEIQKVIIRNINVKLKNLLNFKKGLCKLIFGQIGFHQIFEQLVL